MVLRWHPQYAPGVHEAMQVEKCSLVVFFAWATFCVGLDRRQGVSAPPRSTTTTRRMVFSGANQTVPRAWTWTWTWAAAYIVHDSLRTSLSFAVSWVPASREAGGPSGTSFLQRDRLHSGVCSAELAGLEMEGVSFFPARSRRNTLIAASRFCNTSHLQVGFRNSRAGRACIALLQPSTPVRPRLLHLAIPLAYRWSRLTVRSLRWDVTKCLASSLETDEAGTEGPARFRARRRRPKHARLRTRQLLPSC